MGFLVRPSVVCPLHHRLTCSRMLGRRPLVRTPTGLARGFFGGQTLATVAVVGMYTNKCHAVEDLPRFKILRSAMGFSNIITRLSRWLQGTGQGISGFQKSLVDAGREVGLGGRNDPRHILEIIRAREEGDHDSSKN